MDKKFYTILISLFFSSSLFTFGQGPVKTFNNNNYQLQSAHAVAARNFGLINAIVTDTLTLPFFDDFSGAPPYPDSRLWTNDFVYVNNHFGKNPITQGVATFDHLNALGLPYGAFSKFFTSSADSLSTQAINLLDYQLGMNTLAYSVADSIYLSFFMQSGGFGDAPDLQDSIVLYFLDNNNTWNSVWKMVDKAAPQFKQFFVGINDSKYLFKGFRFMFINYVKNTGNMNHYHLDYVQMKANRTFQDTLIKDVAFTSAPLQLLNKYSIMPYSHFLVNPSAQLANERKVFFRNNNAITSVVASLQAEAYNNTNTQIDLVPFSQRNLNIDAKGDTFIKYNSFNIAGLSGDTPSVRCVYKVVSLGNDETETNTYSSLSDNNVIERTQQFNNIYAYDDGSAEVGFGLDYASLPNGLGFVAIKYTLAKADTFRGIDIMFNRALEDVSNKPISLIAWQEIANGSGKSNKVLYRQAAVPKYESGINGFTTYNFDTLMVLPAGDFYIGWQQNSKFILNVGWDENQANESAATPEIFYDLLGSWEALPPSFKGALMMRPLIGKEIPKYVKVETALKINDFQAKVYPNPTNGNFTIETENLNSVKIFDMQGKLIIESLNFENKHTFEILSKGLYICILTNEFQQQKTLKVIIE